MHKKLVSFIKYNKFFLLCYRLLGNVFLALLRLFVRVKKKRILFMSFGGQKFDDSPRAIFEAMKQDPFFADYEMIWGFTKPDQFSPEGAKKVKVDTLSFYITALSSGIWINNSSVQRGLKLKRKGIVEVNTWHGTPLKKMGNDIANNQSYYGKPKAGDDTIYCAQSEYDRDIFMRLFQTAQSNFIISDLPRNDALLHYEEKEIESIKTALALPPDKKVILYAPTFREYERDKMNACYIKPSVDTDKWRQELGDTHVVLFRAHYEVINVLGIRNDGFFYNVSDYPCLNDLMAVSDLLISDYSSIYFDYSITGKPIFAYPYDYETYQEKRGLYLPLEELLLCGIHYDEDSLLTEIKHYDKEAFQAATEAVRVRFAPHAGGATACVLAALKERVNKK